MIHARQPVSPLKSLRSVHYGWWMVGLTALVMAVAGMLYQSLSVWNPVLRGHFGWTPGQMSWALAFMRMEGGLLGPVEGILVERLGSRRMVLIGLVVLGCGFLLFSRIGELWHFYVVFGLMALGSGLGAWLPMFTALNNWFSRRRATATGWALTGNRLGAVLFVPALAWAIDPEPDRFGWRTTAVGIGVVTILLAFPISRLVWNRPEDYGQRPYGYTPDLPTEKAQPAEAPPAPIGDADPTLREAVRTRSFWMISMGHATVNAVTVTVMVHMGFILDDRGFSLQEIGWVIVTFTAVGGVFVVVSGYIGDRLPIRPTTFAFCAIQSLPILILLVADNVPVTILFAVLIGIGWGGRNTLTVTVRGIYFGRRGWASITAMSMVPLHVLAFVVPVFAGYMFDFTGSFNIPFITIALIGFMGSGLFLLLGEPPRLSSGHIARTGNGAPNS